MSICNSYILNVKVYVAVDADTTALKQYADRSYFLKNYSKSYTPLTRTYRKKIGNNFTVNVLHHSLGSTYKALEDDLASRNEWKGSVDFILMNFAIHYICNDKRNLTALSKFVSKVLNKNGYFIFTYFDGDAILAAAKDGVAKIGPFDIKIISQKGDVTIAKMPLPSIQGTDDIYREEPLATSHMLNTLNKTLKLEMEYSIYDKTSGYMETIGSLVSFSFDDTPKENLFAKLIEYYRLIKVRIYRQK